MPRAEPVRAYDEVFELAEGPVWDADRGRLLWVDILGGSWFEGQLTGDRVSLVDSHQGFDETVGAVFPTSSGGRVIAGHLRIWVVEENNRLAGPSIPLPGEDWRVNDCAVDPSGRLLVGTVSTSGVLDHDRLVRIEHDGTLTVLDDDLSCSNGLAWSADGRILYSTDSVGHRIYARQYDPRSGAVGSRRLHVDFGDEVPDGVCMDAENHLWVAVWGAGEIRRVDPNGRQVDTVRLPVPLTSSVAFVGPGLETLLVTTARENLSPAQLADFPESGSLYLVRPGVPGAPTRPWQVRGANPGTRA